MFYHLLRCVDRLIKSFQPFYATAALVLVIFSSYIIVQSIVTEVRHSSGWAATALHLVFSTWLIFSILFNHAMCIFTCPGFTINVDPQALKDATGYGWRWCKKCSRPKPALAHHCSICNQCVLKLDHHCPWMNNCVGYFNYRHFFLYVFYMWVATAYSCFVLFTHPHWWYAAPGETWNSVSSLEFTVFVMCVSVFIGLSVLLFWHVYLVTSGQGTIDCFDNWGKAKDAKELGHSWTNIYNLGAAANWKETFDVSGPLWWAAWLLPTLQRKRGNGYVFQHVPITEAQAKAGAMLYYDAYLSNHPAWAPGGSNAGAAGGATSATATAARSEANARAQTFAGAHQV